MIILKVFDSYNKMNYSFNTDLGRCLIKEVHHSNKIIILQTGITVKYTYIQDERDIIKHRGMAYSAIFYDENSNFNNFIIDFMNNRMIKNV